MKTSRQSDSHAHNLVLGLDIGAASVGWTLLEAPDGSPCRFLATGVRVFEAGVEGDIASGRDVSRAAARREKRSRRRLLARRRHRLDKLAGILQSADLLPPGDISSADSTLTYFRELDRQLFPPDARRANPHLLPYSLRARALDEPLTPHELGRALYHLAHRRGFLSNRRIKPGAQGDEQEKEEGKVKAAISELAQRIQDAGARTLGEYLSNLNPEEERVRSRWLGRKMLEDEFNAIWSAQAPHHPTILTDALRDKVRRAIFFQRPIRMQRHLIGYCDLEPKRRRAPMCTLAAQRFRLLQKVNDLLIEEQFTRRPLTPEQRATLIQALDSSRRLSFADIRKLLRLPRGTKFNFETEGEKGLPGNRTAHDLAQVFGQDRWDAFTDQQRDQLVEDLRSIHNREALKRRAMRAWGLDESTAQRLADTPLEDGYCNLSRQALAKLLPLMEQGIQYATARKQLYGELPRPQPRRLLPRLDAVPGLEVRNPAVERALSEVRKVVNAVIRRYGKPDRIRIELARDLRKPRKERERIARRNADNRRARAAAADSIKAANVGISDPRRSDEEKWLLADECGWQCPYTGKHISVEALFGDEPQFDVEHIIPFHRSFDNSFVNKTLCEITENRERKRNRTPWEAYHGTPAWDEIIGRVKQFRSGLARAKLELFMKRPEEIQNLEQFTNQQLTDTRYASRLATRYVGLLYGAGEQGVDPNGVRRVESSRGQVTAELRARWGLNAILGGGEKTRDDHRQHAIDAAVVAATDASTIKRFSEAAEAAALSGRRLRELPPPWDTFRDELDAAVKAMVVSHRVSRKVSAALHEETIYSKPHVDHDGRECVHVRKPIESISKKDLPDIVDPAVRKAVAAKLDELGDSAFKDRKNHPTLRARDGREIPIHKVRLRVSVSPELIGGQGAHARRVKLGSNHHIEIIETTDRKGNPRWEGVVVSTLEATRRLKARQPIVQRDHGPGKRFLFSLAGGEIISLDAEENKKGATAAAGLYVVRTITVTSQGRAGVEFAAINKHREAGLQSRSGPRAALLLDIGAEGGAAGSARSRRGVVLSGDVIQRQEIEWAGVIRTPAHSHFAALSSCRTSLDTGPDQLRHLVQCAHQEPPHFAPICGDMLQRDPQVAILLMQPEPVSQIAHILRDLRIA